MIKEKDFIPCKRKPLEEILYKHNYIGSDNNIWETLIYDKFCSHIDKKKVLCLNKKINSKGYCKRHTKKDDIDIIKCNYPLNSKHKNKFCKNVVKNKNYLCHKHKKYKSNIKNYYENEIKMHFNNPILDIYYPFQYKYNILPYIYYNYNHIKKVKDIDYYRYTPSGYLIIKYEDNKKYNSVIKYYNFNKYLINIGNESFILKKKEYTKKRILIKIRSLIQFKNIYEKVKNEKNNLIKKFIYNIISVLKYRTSEYIHIGIINIIKEYIELSNLEIDDNYSYYMDIIEEREDWELHSNVSNFYNTSYSCNHCRSLYYEDFDEDIEEVNNKMAIFNKNCYFKYIEFYEIIYNYIWEYKTDKLLKYIKNIYNLDSTNILRIIKNNDDNIESKNFSLDRKKKKINKKVYL